MATSVRPLALVTGVGRARGIGAAVATRLVADGWDVVASCWRPYDERMPWGADDPAVPVVPGVVEIDADLAVPEEVPRLFDAVAEASGRSPTALVMSHCESVDAGILDTTVESFDRHYAVNVRATWLLVREFALRFPTDAAGGRIVALTSDHVVGNVPYGSTKGAMDRVVLAAAQELAHLGVTANVINPGPTDTGWMTEELIASVVADTPLGRVGQPDDAARLVAFLCSPAGGWVNGQLLTSNGGLSR